MMHTIPKQLRWSPANPVWIDLQSSESKMPDSYSRCSWRTHYFKLAIKMIASGQPRHWFNTLLYTWMLSPSFAVWHSDFLTVGHSDPHLKIIYGKHCQSAHAHTIGHTNTRKLQKPKDIPNCTLLTEMHRVKSWWARTLHLNITFTIYNMSL